MLGQEGRQEEAVERIQNVLHREVTKNISRNMASSSPCAS